MSFYANKTAAITGAASGIGRALAVTLAQRGCQVALCDVDAAGLAETAALAANTGVKVTQAHVDVANREAVYAWAAQVAADHGQVHFIFNNAGVALANTIEGADCADMEWLMGINFWGVVHGTKAFLPHLRKSGAGHVVNVSSIFGLFAVTGNSAYHSAKFAVRGFSECLHQEMTVSGAPVKVSIVMPGGIKTRIARASRFRDDLTALLGGTTEVNKGAFEDRFITTAERAAEIILRGVQRGKLRILVGPDATLMDKIVRWFPAGYHKLVLMMTRQQMAKNKKAASRAPGG